MFHCWIISQFMRASRALTIYAFHAFYISYDMCEMVYTYSSNAIISIYIFLYVKKNIMKNEVVMHLTNVTYQNV